MYLSHTKYGTTLVIIIPMSAATPRIAKDPSTIEPRANILPEHRYR
jgi:hypothetical protein